MLIYVPLDQIDDNPYQARAEYGAIDELTSLNLRLEDARSWGDPELATLAYEVGRALRDVESRLEQRDDND